jgi:DNA-binding transcriptional ArsR family regulator
VSRALAERAASYFRALADTDRLMLLVQLAGGEVCVTELADTLDEALSTVSQRLRLLRAEGLVQRRRAGKHVYYALADAHVHELLNSALDHASEGR